VKTTLRITALEPLVDFRAHLEPKLWPKSQKLVTMSTRTNANLGCIIPILYVAITRRQNMLEICSSLLMTRDVL